ncbi:hypothetical protein BFW01_g10550 [Lasiodiplodia theobromae]|uniref:Uncharacterized protein n=1 Tax=Lasiodiplodia theobromae TaxID=45133 RepID=A0A8H7MAH3_9PEZI|nr:hypothetical protein BFW01_g10550 [Lasiodiplodia theobromae]
MSQETASKAPQQANIAPIFIMTRQRTRAATKKANSTTKEPEHETTLTFTVPERPIDPKPQKKKRTKPQSNDTKHQTTLSFTKNSGKPKEKKEEENARG